MSRKRTHSGGYARPVACLHMGWLGLGWGQSMSCLKKSGLDLFWLGVDWVEDRVANIGFARAV